MILSLLLSLLLSFFFAKTIAQIKILDVVAKREATVSPPSGTL